MKWLLTITIGLMLAVGTARAADISGKWIFTFDTEDGERRSVAVFHLEGQNVTGKWDAADVKGTFADGKLNLSFPFTSPEASMTGTFKLMGRLDSDTIVGKWDFEGHGGTFTAKRPD